MDGMRFDRWTRAVSTMLTRRTLAGALGLGAIGLADLADAKKKKRKRKKKKVKRNEFGCVDVGRFCKKADQCCSGICQGKKGKKKCKAHDATTCQGGETSAECGGVDVPCTSSSGEPNGLCFTTTGKAGYCIADGDCFPCQKDADCIPVCGPQAACVVCADCEEQSGGTGCVGPSAESCTIFS